jgi:DNA-binding IclR family transcriptional regulator
VARSSDGQSSLSRAVALLEAFDTGTRDLTATQISARAGIPLSTAHRIISELVSLGLLERVAERRYRVGLRLWELAVRTPGALGIREIALDAMRVAHSRIGQSLQLGVLQGTEMLYLERLSTPTAAVNFTVVGGRMPFHATSSGLVLAAHLEAEDQRRLLAIPLPRYGPAPRPDAATLEREFATIRRAGFVTTRGYVDAAATAIAVPIQGATGKAVAALSAIVPANDPREEQVLPVLRATSAAITKNLRDRYEG